MTEITFENTVPVLSIPFPSESTCIRWAEIVLRHCNRTGALHIRLVDEAESASFNEIYRHQAKPTNVLSFPFVPPIPDATLGDLVICAPVIQREAVEQHKKLSAHLAHMIVHGTLHLLGYDHQNDEEAKRMETLEVTLLDTLGFLNPYSGEPHNE